MPIRRPTPRHRLQRKPGCDNDRRRLTGGIRTCSLANDVEQLSLSGAAVAGAGDAASNLIAGNAAPAVLSAPGRNDSLGGDSGAGLNGGGADGMASRQQGKRRRRRISRRPQC